MSTFRKKSRNYYDRSWFYMQLLCSDVLLYQIIDGRMKIATNVNTVMRIKTHIKI